ncbi:MAG: hypothetical protein ACQEV6_17685 [Pseudomonadota bacterium]
MKATCLPFLTAVALAVLVPGKAPLAGTAVHSYESCSLIAGEYLTVLQLASRGLDENVLKASLPDISAPAQQRVDSLLELSRTDGLIETYSTIHSEYAACARQVFRHNGMPEAGSRESSFHFCAGENKVRYEITLAAIMSAPLPDVKSSLTPVHHTMATALYRLYEDEGALVVFDNLASELKHCLNNPQS